MIVASGVPVVIYAKVFHVSGPVIEDYDHIASWVVSGKSVRASLPRDEVVVCPTHHYPAHCRCEDESRWARFRVGIYATEVGSVADVQVVGGS